MLYVVATPIGNLQDLSQRAIATLQVVDYIACEDTRHSKGMLAKIGVTARLISFHAHSADKRIAELILLLSEGKSVAVISDAGTPGISDPGGLLVQAVHHHGLPVSPIPGPSAPIAALSVCGFPTDQYIFLGFLPKKKGRQTLLKSLMPEKRTAVFFESPMRIRRTVLDLSDILDGERKICVCRELTKQFEEVWVGKLEAAKQKEWREQGEYVVVIEGQK